MSPRGGSRPVLTATSPLTTPLRHSWRNAGPTRNTARGSWGQLLPSTRTYCPGNANGSWRRKPDGLTQAYARRKVSRLDRGLSRGPTVCRHDRPGWRLRSDRLGWQFARRRRLCRFDRGSKHLTYIDACHVDAEKTPVPNRPTTHERGFLFPFSTSRNRNQVPRSERVAQKRLITTTASPATKTHSP